jgi:hypothetical protein
VGLECSGFIAPLNPPQIRLPVFGAKSLDVKRFTLNKLKDGGVIVDLIREKALM